MSDTMQFEFSKFADELGMCLDQLFMSSQGVPENPYEDQDTKLAYDIWIAGWRASSAAKDARIRELEARIRTLEKNAERYCYWRDHVDEVDDALCAAVNDMREKRHGDALTHDEFDAAIDKARSHPDGPLPG